MRYPKLRELKEAIKALIKGHYTTKFPYVPHLPPKTFRGRPYFYEKDCIGCTACVAVCPTKCLSFEDEVNPPKGKTSQTPVNGCLRQPVWGGVPKRTLKIRLDMCICCGHCQLNCPTEKGIILSNEFDLATTEKREILQQSIEKELLLCAGCQQVIAPCDQIDWVAKRLGPLVFSNTSLMLYFFGQKSLTEITSPLFKMTPSLPPTNLVRGLRSDRFQILCPRCRRQAVLAS